MGRRRSLNCINQPTLYNMYRHVRDISEISTTNWPICVCVTENSGICWSRNKNRYIKLVLEDDTAKIQAMIYDSVDERNDVFKNDGIHQRYIIRGAYVKKSNKQFDTFGHDYELIINKTTSITPCTITNTSLLHQNTKVLTSTSSHKGQNLENLNGQKEIKPKRKLKFKGSATSTLSNKFIDDEVLASEDEFEDKRTQTSPSPNKKQRLRRRSTIHQNMKAPSESESGNGDSDEDKTYSRTLGKPQTMVLRSRTQTVDYSELSDNPTDNSANAFENSTEELETIRKFGRIHKGSTSRLRSISSQENLDPVEVKQRGKKKSLLRRVKRTTTTKENSTSDEIIIVTDESSDEDFNEPQHDTKTPNMRGNEDIDADFFESRQKHTQNRVNKDLRNTCRNDTTSRNTKTPNMKRHTEVIDYDDDFVQTKQMLNKNDRGSVVTKTPNMKGKGAVYESDDDDIVQTTLHKQSRPEEMEESDKELSQPVQEQTPQKKDNLYDSDGSDVTPKTRKNPLKVLEYDESLGTDNNQDSDDESLAQTESYETYPSYETVVTSDQDSEKESTQIESFETINSYESSNSTILTCQSSDEESIQTMINDGLSSYSSINPSYEDNGDDDDTDDDSGDTDDDGDDYTGGDWPEYKNIQLDYQSDLHNDRGKVASLVLTMAMKAYGDPDSAENDKTTRDLTTALMKKINTKREECVSQAWFKDLKTVLEIRPVFVKYEKTNRGSIEDLKDCEVCNRSGRTTEYRVELSGVPYHHDTLEPNVEEEVEDTFEYLVGRFCYMRIRLYHELYHLRYNIYNDCKRKLEHYKTPEKLVKNGAFINKYSRKISKLLRMVELEIFEDGDRRRRGTRFQREFNENF